MWESRPPPGWWIGWRTSERGIGQLTDPRSNDLPLEVTGSLRYETFEKALEELEREIVRTREARHLPVTISRNAAVYLSLALNEYRGSTEKLGRDLEALRREVRHASRAYGSCTGERATGRKERALRRLFGEPDLKRGQRHDWRSVAVDYVRLRTSQGDQVFAQDKDAPGTPAAVAVGCPKSLEESLDGAAWLHGVASRTACKQGFRRFAAKKHSPMERVERLLEVLDQDFPRRGAAAVRSVTRSRKQVTRK